MFTQSWAWSQRSPSWICKTLRPRVRHSAARLGEESETATLSMSKATEGDFASRPSRSSDRSRTVSSSVSVGGRSRSDGGPMPSGNNGSESHRSRSGEWSRRDRGHGSERSHKSSRFHHSTRHRESGERARPKSSSEGSSSRSKQADVMDVRPSTSTHHQHHHNPCPLHLGYGLVLPRLKLRRQRLLAGLPDPVTRRRPFHPASLWWEDPGRTAAQCLPGPTDLNAIDYAVVFGADEVHGSERLQNTPRSGHSPRHRRSGEQTQPMFSGGFSSRARHADPTSSLEVIGGSWVRSGSQLHDRCESVDSVMSGLSYVSRREVQLSPVAPQQTEERTITVIPLPPSPADDGPASDGLAGDDLASDSPADDGPAYDGSAGDGSSRLVSFGWPSSCDRSDLLCTTQQLLLTQHSIRRFRLSTPIASSLQLLCRDALLKNFGFQPQVLSTVRTAPFESSRVLGPEPKVLQNTLRTIRQVDWMAGSSFTFAQRHRDSKSSRKAMSSKKTTSRTSVFDRLGSPTATKTQRTVTQEPPFRAGAGRGVRHRPYSDNRKKSGKFSAASSTNQRWRVPGGGLADFAPHWLSLLGNCRATGIVEDGVGSAFQQRHQLTHQCVSFRTRNSRQDLQQALDVLLLKGAKERVTNMTSLGYYNRLFLVPKKTGDLRSVILSQPPHDSATLQDGDARVRPFSHQKWAISIDIRDAYLHVPMHQAVRRYLRFVVNKQVYQFTGLPFGLATSRREFTKLLRPVVSSKLWSYTST